MIAAVILISVASIVALLLIASHGFNAMQERLEAELTRERKRTDQLLTMVLDGRAQLASVDGRPKVLPTPVAPRCRPRRPIELDPAAYAEALRADYGELANLNDTIDPTQLAAWRQS